MWFTNNKSTPTSKAVVSISSVWDVVFWLFFVLIIGDSVILRNGSAPCLSTNIDLKSHSENLAYLLFSSHEDMNFNLRWLGPAILAALEAIQNGVLALIFLDVTNSAFYFDTPWALTDWVDQRAAGCGPRLIILLVYSGVVLLPVAFVIRRSVRSSWLRLVLLGLVLWPYIGWHPMIVNAIFMVGDLLGDWSKPYFLFNSGFGPNDTLFLGSVFLIFSAASRWEDPKLWQIAACGALAAVTSEFMGLLFALAIFGGTLASGPRHEHRKLFRLGLVRSSIAILATISVIAIAIIMIFWPRGLFYLHGLFFATGFSGELPGNISFNLSRTFGIIASLVAIIVPAIAVGILAGLASILAREHLDPRQVRREFAVLLALGIGWILVFIAGFLSVAVYPQSMGRQFMPFAALGVLFGFIGVQRLFVSRWLIDCGIVNTGSD